MPETSLSKGSQRAQRLKANPNDIICGRGLHIMSHLGNIKLHQVVAKYRDTYQAAMRQEKAALAQRIVEEMKTSGSRFISRVKGGRADEWEEVDNQTAYNKVGHALRLRKKSQKGRDAIPISGSSQVLKRNRNTMFGSSDATTSTDLNGPGVGPISLDGPGVGPLVVPRSGPPVGPEVGPNVGPLVGPETGTLAGLEVGPEVSARSVTVPQIQTVHDPSLIPSLVEPAPLPPLDSFLLQATREHLLSQPVLFGTDLSLATAILANRRDQLFMNSLSETVLHSRLNSLVHSSMRQEGSLPILGGQILNEGGVQEGVGTHVFSSASDDTNVEKAGDLYANV